MLTKEEFVNILDRLDKVNILQDKMHDLLKESYDYIHNDFMDGWGFLICNEDIVVSLLEKIMNDDVGDVSYFIYELNYGRDYKDGMITEADGTIVDFSTAEKLYDYLTRDNND